MCVQEKWEEGYYITAMAGSMSSASLVVMSKGTPYTQQSYKVGRALGWDGFGDMQHHNACALWPPLVCYV